MRIKPHDTDLLAHEMQAAVRVILPDASSEYPDVTLTPQQRKPILRAVNNHK